MTRYVKCRETNPAYYWQMIEGQCPEVVMGRIYPEWKVVETVPHEARLMGYGLDFGFDPDPAAIVAIYWYKLLNSHLVSTFKALPKAPIIADSAEPKSIAELQTAGLNTKTIRGRLPRTARPPASRTRRSPTTSCQPRDTA